MGILRIFGKGIRTAARNSKMLAYLWVINLVFASMIIAPIFLLIRKDFGQSLLGGTLRTPGFTWLGELIYKYQNIPQAIAGWFLIPTLLFGFLYIFLNGGIIGRVAAEGEKVTLQNFFGDCGRYFWRFLRIFLVTVVGFALVFGILFRLISAAFKPWIESASNEVPTIIASNLRTLVFLLIFTIVQMYFDYIKVSLVIRDSKKVLSTALSTLGFIGRRFFKAWVLYLLVGIVFIAFTILYFLAGKVLPKEGLAAFLIAFVWGQAYIWLRIGIKVLFFSTESHFYKLNRV
ncbi:MAG: hypothetical protein NTV82_03500 [Candidatus Aminicenantes bacterium]|nr:hypothetical protein [Candidatus Aminicenantes bacterium]